VGSLDPNHIHLPGIFVDRIVQAGTEREIECLTLRPESDSAGQSNDDALGRGETRAKREMMAKVGA